LQERLIIETKNVELQKELFTKEQDEYHFNNATELDELTDLQETYQQMVKEIQSKKNIH
jgi:hypothetical protein